MIPAGVVGSLGREPVELPVVIPSLAAVKYWVQTPLGVSEWVTVDQERIDRFAVATDDRQWIHVDVERARRESPWKQTIAHGYLTLALVPELLSRRLVILGREDGGQHRRRQAALLGARAGGLARAPARARSRTRARCRGAGCASRSRSASRSRAASGTP